LISILSSLKRTEYFDNFKSQGEIGGSVPSATMIVVWYGMRTVCTTNAGQI
jgi:hypothetical protein